MGSVLSSFGLRSTQSSGLSPSSTEETGHKAPLGQETHTEEEQKSSITDEKPLEEPESNDTSYGVEATAVRTLAASTGTVAILGTTAKVKELNEPALVDLRHSPTESIKSNTEVITSAVSAIKDNEEIAILSEKKEAPIADSINHLKKNFEKQWEEGVLQTKDFYSLTEERKKDVEDKTGMKEENVEEKREGKIEEKVGKREDGGKEEYKKAVQQRDRVITKDVKVDQSVASVPHKIETAATVETSNLDSTSAVIEIRKEPVKIVDFQEKKDRAHEPKIVEEMSVKKEENFNKVPGGNSLTIEEDFEKIVSTNEQEQQLKNEERLTEITISNEELNRAISESEPVSPETSKTEEDNEISSERLKTNSLSDMSLSENLNSEGEEIGREAAKALELKEMVASLSATANHITLDYEISENVNNPRDVPSVESTVNPSSHVPRELKQAKAELSKTNNVPEKNIEENDDKSFEIPQLVSESSSEKETSTVSAPETSEETISSSENSQGEKESNKQNEEEIENYVDTLKVTETEYKTHQKENDKRETEPKTFGENNCDIASENKMTIEDTTLQYHEIQQNKTQQNMVKSIDIEENGEEDEVNRFKPKEADLINYEERKNLELNKDKEQKEEDGKTLRPENSNGKVHQRSDHKNVVQKIETESEAAEKSEEKDNPRTIPTAIIVQSGFQGYQVEKQIKQYVVDDEIKQILGEEEKVFEEEKKLLIEATATVPEVLDEKELIKTRGKYLLARSESKIYEEGAKRVPESLIKIAQAEVDKICKDAEQATESLMTPPLMKDNSEIEIQEEEFPAPPDELLNSESQNEEIKEDQSSSGTKSTEPTMPLGNNHSEGDSSKTEDTTAPSLAESEMPKSAGPSPSLKNDDIRLESSVTENINTETTMQRDSTEGELTMEEDSTREDDVLAASTRSDIVSKTDGEDSLTPEEEKAATVIQAGYRGFKTRKRLREESSTRSDNGTVERDDIEHEPSNMKSSIKVDGEPNSSNSLSDDKSDKELNDSAKKIQAGVRGYLVRKKKRVERDAAITIQSHFRGFKTRQRLKQKST